MNPSREQVETLDELFQYRLPRSSSCMPELYVNPRQLSNTTDSNHTAAQSSVTTVTDLPTLTATSTTDSQVRVLPADQAQFSLYCYHLAQQYSHL